MSQLPSTPFTIPGGVQGPAGQIGNPYFSPQGGMGGFTGAVAGVGAAAGGPAGIAGALPFGAGGAGMFGGNLAGSYAAAYNDALKMNQENYGNILKGYQQTAANQTSAQQAIGSGYGQLYNTIMGGIQGIGQSQSQAIGDVYAQQSGKLAQEMTSKGLGNTTVGFSEQRGLQFDQQKAQIALANQLAGLQAGYAGQIGGAALNYANAAAMQNTALSSKQLDWMNSVNAKYPDAGAYTSLLQQQGAIDQANQDRALLRDQLNKINPYAGYQFGGGRGSVTTGAMHGMPGMETGTGGGVGPAGAPPPPVTGPGMIRTQGIDPGTGMQSYERTTPYQGTYGAGMIGAALDYGRRAADPWSTAGWGEEDYTNATNYDFSG